MRRFVLGLLGLWAAGCFSVPASTSPVKGTDVGVIVHNYAMAFRDFVRAAEPTGLLAPQLFYPLPLTAAEWHADDVTSPAPVTTTVDGVETTARVRCAADTCARSLVRKFRDGLRIDQTADVWYRRGVTGDASDDVVTGFVSTVRYHDEVVSRTAATAPTAGAPWTVETTFRFGNGDDRTAVTRTQTYAALGSDATPRAVKLVYKTKENASTARYAAEGDAWTFHQQVAYGAFRSITGGTLAAGLEAGRLTADQHLFYSDPGFDYAPLTLRGGDDDWSIGGATLIGGQTQGRRAGAQWRRETLFPDGSRFSSLTDEGKLPDAGGRGTFTRTIAGLAETIVLSGTYREKAPGVYELSMTSNVAINAEFTYRSLDLDDVFQGVWVQPNARASSQDVADFTLYARPDWTTQMNYTYDRADTPFTPDEAGTMHFVPDTRGTATVSVVKEKAGATQRHVDYSIRIVAEGQKP